MPSRIGLAAASRICAPVGPRVTAVVPTLNDESMIERCLTALEMSDYHDLEVIVSDAGSTDTTLALARRYPFTVLTADGSGTGSAAIDGLEAASGEIVAFVDASVACHPHWPWFVALPFEQEERVAVVSRHLIAADADAGHVARAATALAGIDHLPSPGPARLLASGSGGLAVRRSAARKAANLSPGSTPQTPVALIHALKGVGGEAAVLEAPAAQAIRPAPQTLRSVWRHAVAGGRVDKKLRRPWSDGDESRPRPLLDLLATHGGGDRTPWAQIARGTLDMAAVPLAVTVVMGAIVALLGGGLVGLGPAAVAGGVLTTLVVVVVAGTAVSARSPGAAPAVAIVVLLESLGRAWGRARTTPRPPAPATRTWTGVREEWLSELRWRLGSQRLSVVRPGGGGTRWDIEVRCGLFLRRLIVTAVVWRWTPHVRSAWRPRWLLLMPVAIVGLVLPWSPMAAAMIASATIGELAFEVVTLRRVDGIVEGSISGSLPPVDSSPEPPSIELAARSTLEL